MPCVDTASAVPPSQEVGLEAGCWGGRGGRLGWAERIVSVTAHSQPTADVRRRGRSAAAAAVAAVAARVAARVASRWRLGWWLRWRLRWQTHLELCAHTLCGELFDVVLVEEAAHQLPHNLHWHALGVMG